MLRGIQQLVNADAYPGFNALSDGINAALDCVEIVEQVGRLAKQVAPDSVSSMLRVLRVNSTTSRPISMRLMV
jgi:hypothetical protein